MRTMSYIFHLGCFQCVMCGQPLQVQLESFKWKIIDFQKVHHPHPHVWLAPCRYNPYYNQFVLVMLSTTTTIISIISIISIILKWR